MFKATLNTKAEGENDNDWESVGSVEEDFPVVGLEELLDGLKLDDGPKKNVHDLSDDEEDKKNEYWAVASIN